MCVIRKLDTEVNETDQMKFFVCWMENSASTEICFLKKECILSQYFIVRKLVRSHILLMNIAFFVRIYTAEVKHAILWVNMIIFLPTDFLVALFS